MGDPDRLREAHSGSGRPRGRCRHQRTARAGGDRAVGGDAEGYRPLLEALGVHDLYLNGENLLYSYEAFRQRHDLEDDECAYIGDDIGDIEVLARVGLPATAIDGADYLRNRVGYIAGYEGGKGCVREIVEMILTHQDKWPYIERPDPEE